MGSMYCHYRLANAYRYGDGVGKDLEKAIHHNQIAAMAGHVAARHNLGVADVMCGNIRRGMKHFIISAMAGESASLKKVGEGFRCGMVSKEEYEKALRAHKCAKDAMKSEQRDRAAAIIKEEDNEG